MREAPEELAANEQLRKFAISRNRGEFKGFRTAIWSISRFCELLFALFHQFAAISCFSRFDQLAAGSSSRFGCIPRDLLPAVSSIQRFPRISPRNAPIRRHVTKTSLPFGFLEREDVFPNFSSLSSEIYNFPMRW